MCILTYYKSPSILGFLMKPDLYVGRCSVIATKVVIDVLPLFQALLSVCIIQIEHIVTQHIRGKLLSCFCNKQGFLMQEVTGL